MLRLDHRFSDKTTLSFAPTSIDAVNTAPLASSGNYLPGPAAADLLTGQWRIELLHISSSTLLNEFKFGFNRSTADTTDLNQTGAPYAFSVSGFTTLNNNRISIGVGNSFSGIDNLTWVKGRHTVKAGVEIRRVQLNQGNTEAGTVAFASLAAFEANQVSTATLNGAFPDQWPAQDAILRLSAGRIQMTRS